MAGFALSAHQHFPLFLPGCLTGRFDPDIYLNRVVARRFVGKRLGPWCSGSAVQLRHYPVTVSAESKAGLYAATGRRSSGKVRQAQSMRKSGDRPGSRLSCLSVSMGGPKGARFSRISAGRRIPGFRVCLYGFAARVSSFARGAQCLALGCRLSRLAYCSTIHEVSGSAV